MRKMWYSIIYVTRVGQKSESPDLFFVASLFYFNFFFFWWHVECHIFFISSPSLNLPPSFADLSSMQDAYRQEPTSLPVVHWLQHPIGGPNSFWGLAFFPRPTLVTYIISHLFQIIIVKKKMYLICSSFISFLPQKRGPGGCWRCKQFWGLANRSQLNTRR